MRIGVFCSGGDSPGMNACLRAVVRSALDAGHEVVGILYGYEGLLAEDFFIGPSGERVMGLRSVSDILRRGGTILHSSRSEEFRTDDGQRKAADILRRHRIDALVPIGGDGTLRGAMALARFWEGRIVACPGTIDNDLIGTDFTIGFHTAVDTAAQAVDKLRDTAESHRRMFLVEVMGRHSGYIALYTALVSGAEIVCLPETPTDVEQMAAHAARLKSRGKTSVIAVVAEGDELGGAMALHVRLKASTCPFDTRVVTLGHLQRGGSPVPVDRILASRLGDFAVRGILAGKTGVLAGEIRGELTLTPFEQACRGHKPLPQELLALLETLSA